MKKAAFTFALIILAGCLASAQSIPSDSLYLGQTPPGTTPQIFAPGIVSLPGRMEYGITIAPAGDEMMFALGNWPYKRTMIIRYENNHWTAPDTVSFSVSRSAEEAIYSPGGERVYYYAYNPPNPVGGADLCYSIKTGSVWGEPVNLGTPLNTTQDEYHPCMVADSSLYFENVAGKICYAKFQNGAYLPRVLMPPIFNDPGQAWGNPYVSPDEDYFIFNSSRPGGFGGTDLYISYKKDDGTWTNPKNLGNVINNATNQCGSEITDDSLYMTFVSNNDVYWVGSGFIDSLRYTNFIPYVLNKIPDQTAYKGQMFNFTIPDSTFVDDDGNSTLTFQALLTNGNALPGWLTFDTLTGSFSGTPEEFETLNIRVTATDTAGAGVSTTFKIMVQNPVNTEPDPGQKQGILIFPNPVRDYLTVHMKVEQHLSLIIMNIHGKEVFRSTLARQENRFDISHISPGLYIMHFKKENEIVFFMKMVKM